MTLVGVIGTMVWDTIWREADLASPVEEWGGISYALAAADATQSGSKVRPVLKLGHDLAERGYRFLRELSVIESDEAISVIDEPSPRVELRYQAEERRCEQIGGWLPAWTFQELEPRIRGCDALYVNFITGSELDLATARQMRKVFEGPIFADIHSLTLATDPGGKRRRRHLPDAQDWLKCFDVVQVNQDELASLSANHGDPWEFAKDAVNTDTRLLFITLGSKGAAYVMTPDALPLRSESAAGQAMPQLIRTGKVDVEPVDGGDPTGCGDVWGMTAFCALLEGHEVEEAMRRACALARRNVVHRGASGLSRFLRGGIASA